MCGGKSSPAPQPVTPPPPSTPTTFDYNAANRGEQPKGNAAERQAQSARMVAATRNRSDGSLLSNGGVSGQAPTASPVLGG